MPQPVRPKAYAKNLTASQYGPLLKQLKLQGDQTRSQGLQNIADIASYYGQVQDAITQAQQQGGQYATGAMNQQAGDEQSLLDSLGGSASGAAGNAAAFAALMHGALTGGINAQHSYLGNLGVAATQNATSAKIAQQNANQAAMQAVNDKIDSETAAKSAAYKANLADAQQLKLQQLAARQNMNLAGKQFNLTKKATNAQIANTNLQNKGLAKQLAGKDGNPQKFTHLTVGDKSKLAQAVNGVMYDRSDGTASDKPLNAWLKAANQLRALGYNVQKNAHVRTYLSQLWMNYVHDYNSAHPNHPFKGAKPNGTPYTTRDWLNKPARPKPMPKRPGHQPK